MAMFVVSPDARVNSLVERCGYAAAALTMLPLPGSEILGVMPLHVGMVAGIAQAHGADLTQESATELLLQIGTTVGASLVGSRIATTAAKFMLPGLGGLVAAPFMFASTLAIGVVADQWFRSNGNLSEQQMKEAYERAVREARSSFRPDRAKSSEAMDEARAAVDEAKAGGAKPAEDGGHVARLQRAKEMLTAGLIDQDEFDALKARILSEL